MLDEYRKRRDQLHAWLAADPRLRCRKPAGAFYLFVDVSDVLSPRRLADVRRLREALLDEARVAVTPGEAFDAPGFVRISYATSMENLREGSARLLEFVAAPALRSRRRPRADGMPKVVAVIGASSDRRKFGNRAVRAFRQQGYTVIPINPHERGDRRAEGVRSVLDVPGPIDMASFYVPPEIGERVIDEVAKKGIPEVWLNPGAESDG